MANETLPTGADLLPEAITQLLARWAGGDASALEALIPFVENELRALARSHMSAERRDHTLQPTALVNEVYLKLVGQRHVQWENRRQFYAFAAQLMRRILVDHARSKRRAKRGGPSAFEVPLDSVELADESRPEQALVVDEALTKLEGVDRTAARVAELRIFAGLTHDEIAETLAVSLATVKRNWNYAGRWLARELRLKARPACRPAAESRCLTGHRPHRP